MEEKEGLETNPKLNSTYGSIFEKSFIENPIMIGISTLDTGRYIMVNQAFCSIMGYSIEETIGHTSLELGIWKNIVDREKFTGALVKQNKTEYIEAEFLTKERKVVLCKASVELINFKDQACLAFLMADISERKVYENAVRRSGEKFTKSFYANPVMMYIAALRDGRIIEVNDTLADTFGYSRQEIIGHAAKDLEAWIEPLDLENLIETSIKNGKMQPVEVKARTRDHQALILVGQVEYIKIEDELCMLISLQDITEKKAAIAELRRINQVLRAVQDIHQLISQEKEARKLLKEVCNIMHQQLGFSTSWAGYYDENQRFTGFVKSGGQELPDKLKANLDAGVFSSCVQQSLKEGKFVTVTAGDSICHACIYFDRTELGSRRIVAPMISSGKILGVLGASFKANLKISDEELDLIQKLSSDLGFALHDIEQEQKRLKAEADLATSEERFRKISEVAQSLYEKEKQQTRELREEARTRGLFIDVLAHELRTPLTPIQASAAMLEDLIKDKTGVEAKLAKNIVSGSHTLAYRLEELLDVARYSRGTFKLKRKIVNMNQFISESIAHFKPALDKANQELIVEIAGDLGSADIDAPRLEQVVTNLLSNASKFSPQKGQIFLKAQGDSDNIVIEICDKGIGITREEQERLFQPYHRVEQDRQKFPGIGLGLAVSKQIVESHGGIIWLNSDPGKGSTFSMRIPRSAKVAEKVNDQEQG